MQLLIAVLGLLTALVPFVASIVQLIGSRQRPPEQEGATAARPDRKGAVRLLGLAVGIAVLSLVSAFVVVPWLRTDKPLAEIRSPLTGDRIKRPEAVDVRLNGAVPDNGSVWLGYQNEEGGPFIVQASRCVAIGNRLDCGPLYVGHDKKDPAEFRVFVMTADAVATAKLAAGDEAQPGDNVSHGNLPEGSRIVTEARRITLRDSA